MQSPHPEVDNIENIDTEVAKVALHAADQILPGESWNPGAVFSAPRANFGHDHEAVPIRMESFPDDLIGYMRAIVVAGIDVIHPCIDGFAQHRDGLGSVARRSPHMRSRQLHGAVPHAVDSDFVSGKSKRAPEAIRACHSPVSSQFSFAKSPCTRARLYRLQNTRRWRAL